MNGCGSTREVFWDSPTYLENDLGQVLSDCTTYTNYMGEVHSNYLDKSEAKSFWKKNNFPKGTLYWLCDGTKPVLPKDCQGKPLTTPKLRRYWKKYDLPRGTEEFNCTNGVPTAKP